MKDTTLPTLIDFLFNLIGHKDGYEFKLAVIKFIKFLALKLQLWMFIPCKDGVPLEEPYGYKIWLRFMEGETIRNMGDKFFETTCEEYQQALDRTFIKWNGTREQLDIILRDNKTIGDLCGRIELTESKHKELNL